MILLFSTVAISGCKKAKPEKEVTNTKAEQTISEKPLPYFASTTTTLRLRKKPSTKAKKVKCNLYGPASRGLKKKGIKALPEDFTVKVIKRSAKKSKVGKRKDYWYKVIASVPEDAEADHCFVSKDASKPAVAWVFGGFLEYLGQPGYFEKLYEDEP